MTPPREPDRFEAKARTLCDSMSQLPADLLRGYLAAAFRAAEASALERAAQGCAEQARHYATSAAGARATGEQEEASYLDYRASTWRDAESLCRALAPSPEAPPANCTCRYLNGARFENPGNCPVHPEAPPAKVEKCECGHALASHLVGRYDCCECGCKQLREPVAPAAEREPEIVEGCEHYPPHLRMPPPSEPVAPAPSDLLPRVLAALEKWADYDDGEMHDLAAELRQYIAALAAGPQPDPRDQRIAELETWVRDNKWPLLLTAEKRIAELKGLLRGCRPLVTKAHVEANECEEEGWFDFLRRIDAALASPGAQGKREV